VRLNPSKDRSYLLLLGSIKVATESPVHTAGFDTPLVGLDDGRAVFEDRRIEQIKGYH
jgi:hypothetical protein